MAKALETPAQSCIRSVAELTYYKLTRGHSNISQSIEPTPKAEHHSSGRVPYTGPMGVLRVLHSATLYSYYKTTVRTHSSSSRMVPVFWRHLFLCDLDINHQPSRSVVLLHHIHLVLPQATRHPSMPYASRYVVITALTIREQRKSFSVKIRQS